VTDQQKSSDWLPPLNYRLRAAAIAWQSSLGEKPLDGDLLVLWVNTTREGRALRAAVDAYDTTQPILDTITQAASRGASDG
jgi:hypothetical protein